MGYSHGVAKSQTQVSARTRTHTYKGGKFSPNMQILKRRGMDEPYLKTDINSLDTVGAGKHLLQNYFLD